MEDEQTSICSQSDCLVSTPGFHLQPACLFSVHPPANVQHLASHDPSADRVLWEQLWFWHILQFMRGSRDV